MTWFFLIMAFLFCETMNEVWTNKPLPPRYWKMNDSIEHELKHKSDSLLNNWAEWAKSDTL